MPDQGKVYSYEVGSRDGTWHRLRYSLASSATQENTPPPGGVFNYNIPMLARKLYMASEPPSPSGQGPLPRAVVETSSLPTTGTVHVTILLLWYRDSKS